MFLYLHTYATLWFVTHNLDKAPYFVGRNQQNPVFIVLEIRGRSCNFTQSVGICDMFGVQYFLCCPQQFHYAIFVLCLLVVQLLNYLAVLLLLRLRGRMCFNGSLMNLELSVPPRRESHQV
ncbi:hypothetical protein GOODEAATRI_024845 [Goodea atripinnis]|uniref:Uncharacterized protein n=1 Tax=Goodea atripinnis TaxID=208336 RepID=A0ABV0MVL7_9TELE